MIEGRVENILSARQIELIKYEVEKQTCRIFKRLPTSNYSLKDCETKSQNQSLTKDLDGLCIHNIEEATVFLKENCGQYEFGDISPLVSRTISMEDTSLHKPKKNAILSTSLNDDNKCEQYTWYVIYFGIVIGAFWFAIFYVWLPMIKAIMA